MAINPMQRKSRNSFLLGMIVAILICAILAAVVYFLIIRPSQTKQNEEGTLTYAYRLKTNKGAGQTITAADVEEVIVTSKVVPAGAFPSRVKSTDSKGKETWKPTAFPGSYIAKIDLNSGTILAQSLVTDDNSNLFVDDGDGGKKYADNVRYVEYNMLTLSTTVMEGEFIDIRLSLPNGQDLIVVSKKEVKSILGNTVGFEMTEDEILMMESAIVEAYIMKASNLYVTQYIEPGLQKTAEKTYTPTEAVKQLINGNPNITSEARSALTARFNDNLRTWTDSDRGAYGTEQKQNLEENVKTQIENAQKAREAYLSGLTSY
ncbi:MAG: hypothetical protein J5507_02335 [Clostridia bacterium]|nr:hypothetical protein [Clostridia bacterium]